MKGDIFLTSSVDRVAHDLVKRADFSHANKLVFITTASEPKGEKEDLAWQKNDRQKLVDAGFVVSDYTITGKLRDQLRADLSGFDCIYLSGGDTFYLLEQSQKSDFVSLIRELVEVEGKTYIGTSAGSIIAGPRLMDYHQREGVVLPSRDAYGLVHFTVIPHWGSEGFREKYLGGRIAMIYTEEQVPLILLTDYQYVHVHNGYIEIVDVRMNETKKTTL